MLFLDHLRASGTYYTARFHRNEEGAVATEYGFLIVFIAIAVAIGAVVLGQGLLNLFDNTGDEVSTTTVSNIPAPATNNTAPIPTT